MKKVKGFSVEEVKKLTKVTNGYSESYFKDLSTEYKGTSIKIKKSKKKTTEDKIIDMSLDGECPDSIAKELGIKYSQVVVTLTDNGML